MVSTSLGKGIDCGWRMRPIYGRKWLKLVDIGSRRQVCGALLAIVGEQCPPELL